MHSATTLTDLARDWDAESRAKWEALRGAQGHFISAHSPQWTMREDIERRRQTRRQMMCWAVEWFRSRGVAVECLADERCADTFSIHLSHATPATAARAGAMTD